MMKTALLTIIAVLVCNTSMLAQTNLAGRVYYNANILADEMNKMTHDVEQDVAKGRAKIYAKFEQKKGRKPTEAEKAKLEAELQKALATARAIKKGMTTKITVEFKNDKEVVMDADVKISDEAMKLAGISWIKRKAFKAALAMAPSKNKCTYVVNGNQIIFDDGSEKDTLRLSDDGKYLYGKFDKKTNFKLIRTK